MSKNRQKPHQKAREPTQPIKHPPTRLNAPPSPPKLIREGEVWSIGGAKIRGHKGLMTNVTDTLVEIIETTHGEETNHIKNIPLRKNWDKEDPQDAYMLPQILTEKRKKVQRKHPEMHPSDPVDKSIIRHMKNERRKNKHKKRR